jgi:membrane protein implicated in regulation of membrane protease activity
MNEMMILWIVVLITTLVIEAMTMGLTTIWFSGGALIALIVEMLNGSIYMQIIAFLIISLVLLFYTRPIAMKHFNKEREKTNLDTVIGNQAVVTIPIHNIQETGQVIVEGKEWTARSNDSSKYFEKDTLVRIVSIQGVKLIVEEIKQHN